MIFQPAHLSRWSLTQGEPLTKRAATFFRSKLDGQKPTLSELIRRMKIISPHLFSGGALAPEAIIASVKFIRDPFPLTLPLLISASVDDGLEANIRELEPPPSEDLGGVPSYAFDKHTAAGKRALGLLSERNPEVRDTLKRHVHPQHWKSVTSMAGFYVDAAPVDREYIWSRSDALNRMGFEADMAEAGCPPAGVDPVFETVRANLTHLNEIRRKLRVRSAGK